IILAVFCLLAAVQAQTREPTPREICRIVNERCLSRVPVHGNRSEVTDILNARCRRRHRNWRNINRCDLARATCQCKCLCYYFYKETDLNILNMLLKYFIVTIERCAALSCVNIRAALAS
ncbi:hypothetical protein KR200_004847, partial [Drosophila serrata]